MPKLIYFTIAPHVAGGGKAALPDGMPLRLELRDQECFRGGMVYLRYRVEHADRDVADDVGTNGA